MAKNKAKSQRKKRTKSYTGEDAAVRSERVTRITAVKKGKIRTWLGDNRQRLAGYGVVVGVIFIIYGLIWILGRFVF